MFGRAALQAQKSSLCARCAVAVRGAAHLKGGNQQVTPVVQAVKKIKDKRKSNDKKIHLLPKGVS